MKETRSKQILVRVTPDEKKQIAENARIEGRSISDYARRKSLKK